MTLEDAILIEASQIRKDYPDSTDQYIVEIINDLVKVLVERGGVIGAEKSELA